MISFFTNRIIGKSFNVRYDGHPKLRYESADEYGCSAKKFSFYSGKNLLRGEKVYFGDLSSCKKALVFFHGAGGGHTAYEKEIAYFARHGYLVYAYDNTGCMDSEGRVVGDLAQSVSDAKAFFDYLKEDRDIKGMPLYALGHSWGGLATIYCLKEEVPVKKCVSLAGIADLATIYGFVAKMPGWLQKPIRRGIRRCFGKDAAYPLELLANAKKPFKYYYGNKDRLMIDSGTTKKICEISKQNPNVSYVELKERGHNCYWSVQSEDYFFDLKTNKNYLDLSCDPSIHFDMSKIKDDSSVLDSIIDFFNL